MTDREPRGELPTPQRDRQRVEPVSPGRYKIQFTASQAFRDKLEQARALLGHQVPDGDVAQICERALDLLIDDLMHQRFATPRRKPGRRGPTAEAAPAYGRKASDTGQPTSRDAADAPPPHRPSRRSRHIPHPVRRQVFERDGLRCTYVAADGRRCSSTTRLELHHLAPFGRGGTHHADNLTLRCRPHNLHAAEGDYGPEVMRAVASKRPHGRET